MKVRIGILSFAHMHAHSYAGALAANPRVDFVGIADADQDRAVEMASLFGTIAFPSSEALLHEHLDGVIVCSENVHHRALVEAAASSGVTAILCEKPIATSVEDARAMIAVCAGHNVLLATAFPCRYSPAFLRLREVVRSGSLGRILAIRGTNHGRMPGGWFIDKDLSGGGAVIDHTVHVADLIRWLLGQDAVEVHAEIGNGFYHQDWDDTGFLTLKYSGGAFATLDTSWSRPPMYPTWGDVTLQIVATNGVVDLDMFAQSLSVYDQKSGNVSWPGWGSNIDAGMVDDFVGAAFGNKPEFLATGEDGLKALEVALAAYQSGESHIPVQITTPGAGL